VVERDPVSAREAVLARVRSAVSDAEPAEAPEPRPPAPARDAVELFCERVADYRATVHRCPAEEVGEVVAGLAAGSLAVPGDLRREWLPSGAVTDEGLSARELDGLDGAVTGCELAIAETGTIVLRSGGRAQGRRALTLVPDLHVCVVREDQVLPSVPAAIAALEGAARDGDPLTLVSGPSATSDIELSRVEGVHGPRTLHVIVAA
jgi:L-lactate dehydrogenase complex protein LldG